jgi:hypothetical protein
VANGQWRLMSGMLSSEIQGDHGEFQVRVPAGAVTSSAGRFTVRATNRVLPRLQVAADRSETLSGTVVAVGEVRVGDGAARIHIQGTTLEIAKGTGAVFSRSDVARTLARPEPADIVLSIGAGAAKPGSLATSMYVAQDHLWLDVRAVNISLKRLLELVTSAPVRGGEGIQVEGHLRIPAEAPAESVASAIGSALGIPISFREETTRRTIATGSWNPATTGDWAQGEFTFTRAANGSLAFEFRAIPAGQVLRILRMAVADLPEIAVAAAAVPVTLQAAELSPRDVAAWLEKTMGLQLQIMEHSTGVIEVGNAPAGSQAAPLPAAPRLPVRPPDARNIESSRDRLRDDTSSRLAGAGTGAVTDLSSGPYTIFQSEARGLRRLESALASGSLGPVWGATAGWSQGSTSVATGKTTPKQTQFLGARNLLAKPGPSTHLIWPALGREGALGVEPGYRVFNPTGLVAQTIWSGFDREGNLIAQYDIRVDAASILAILPTRDLPSFLGEGGHWETVSDLPLAGGRESGLSEGLGLPVGGDQWLRQWAFPCSWLGLGARVWASNPGASEAVIMISQVRNGTTVAAERFDLPRHGSLIWPEGVSGMGTAGTVIVRVVQGTAVSSLK